ncbi:MAG: cobalt ECF transporter T component CbiQ [Chloroflexi bacterium]|nr:cobalt ECF transporter T component CbiQ [Chloroflexota bacterium]
MKHTFLNRYRHGTSLIHQLDPRLKLLATLAFVLAVTSTPPAGWPAFALLAVLAAGSIRLAGIPLWEGLRRSTIALPFVGMAAFSLPFTRAGQVVWGFQIMGWQINVTDAGLLLFASVMVKAWLSVLVSGLLVVSSPFTHLVSAMRALRVPPALTSTISFMYRYLFVLVDEALRLQTAREARSAGRGRTVLWRAQVLGWMVGSLFIRSYERSERIYVAMLSRGFTGEEQSLMGLTWRPRDSWAGLAWAGTLLVVGLLGRVWASSASGGL